MSKKRKVFLRKGPNYHHTNQTANNGYETNVLDEETKKLREQYKNLIKNEEFLVFCYEKNKTYSYKVMKMHLEVVYVGGADANGYAQGRLEEERVAKIDPTKGIISEDSDMGKKLLASKIGSKITVGERTKLSYRVLHVPGKKLN